MPNSWGCNSFYFYIKPQLLLYLVAIFLSCNSFYFYIKPQPFPPLSSHLHVVIHSISTSNHNRYSACPGLSAVVIHSISTSNHN